MSMLLREIGLFIYYNRISLMMCNSDNDLLSHKGCPKKAS